MQAECEAFRKEYVEGRGDPASLGASVREHLAGCAACRSWSSRRERVVWALEGLARVEVPSDLEGRVVAVRFAGERQERAVRSVRDLGTVPAPAGLAERLDRELLGADRVERVPAPAELRRRVAQELADPAAATVARHVGGLERRTAPAELDRRVAGDLRVPAPGPGRSGPMRWASWTLAAAAALLAVLGFGEFGSSGSDGDPEVAEASPLSFRIVPVSDPAELSGMARALIEPTWGGMLSKVDRGKKL